MGRAPCCSKVGLNRGPWTPEEDMLLTKHIERHGEGNWRALPKAAGLLRCGKSCRLRWVNYLRPNVKRGNISEDEEDLIIMLHALLGNRWSLIAARMPGRTDNEIKNYWNTHLSKKLASRGLDPKTHKPLIKSTSVNQSSAGKKKADDIATSQSNLDNSSTDDGDRQEAWETTMDLDTSSYSTGSCEEDDDRQQRHKIITQPKVCARLHKKRQMPVLAELVKEKTGLASPALGAGPGGDAGGPTQSSQGRDDHLLQVSNTKLFDHPSPSSVFHLYSPSPSGSNSNSNTHSGIASNCDSPTTISKANSAASIASSWSTPPVNTSKHSVDWSEQEHQQQQSQVLEFIDDFLRKDDVIVAGGADLFKEDGSSDQFWDSLGKIELPDCSSVCQSDLWYGLPEFVPSPPPVSLASSNITMQMVVPPPPPHSSSSSSTLLPLTVTPPSSSSTLGSQLNFIHDELLFC